MAYRGALVGLLGCVFVLSVGAARASEVISVPSNPIPTAPLARPAPGPLTGKLTLPGQSGPYPVVILLHHCAGFGRDGLFDRWTNRLIDWGYGVFLLDSFGPRHVASVCAPTAQPSVTVADRTGDAINAALALQNIPGVDGKRIGALGLSHGGATAANLVRPVYNAFRPGLIKAAVDYYGRCNPDVARAAIPLLVLAGDADNWGFPAKSCTEFKERAEAGSVIEVVIYPGVYHAFDNEMLTRAVSSEGHPLKYDYPAATDSYEKAHAFLDRYVRDAK